MFQSVTDTRIHATARSAVGGESISPVSVRGAMSRLDYDPWAAAAGRQSVPRTFLRRLPPDLASVRRTAQAQQCFVTMMLPVVLRANEIISLQRSMLRTLQDTAAVREAMWQIGAENEEQLERRFDIMPPSLIIALAAAETDWGRNYTTARGLFPEALSAPANLPPSVASAADGLRHAHHADLLGPVMDVLHGLNTARGGGALRRERARQRSRRKLDGYRLALLLEQIQALPRQTVASTLYALEGGALSRLDAARLDAPNAVFH